MKKWSVLLVLLLGCQKKDAPQNESTTPPQTSSSVSNPESHSSTSTMATPKPDSNSFFPLLEGSYWVYESFQNQEKQEGSREVDSIISAQATDSGFFAHAVEKGSEGDVLPVEYKVDKNGIVWEKRGKAPSFEAFTALSPELGKKVGDRSFYACSGSDSSIAGCALLQPYPGDDTKLTEDQRQAWNGFFLKKGIGLDVQAGVEVSRELMEYRIGLNGAVVKARK